MLNQVDLNDGAHANAAVQKEKTVDLNNEKAVGCNLDLEIMPEDEALFKKLELNETELKLKDESLEKFWKMIAEKLRCKLSDTLEDNQEV